MKIILNRNNKKLSHKDKQEKFLKASRLFRKKLKEKGISFSELLKRSRKIREEIADERFPDKK